jgi:hypothetical protein
MTSCLGADRLHPLASIPHHGLGRLKRQVWIEIDWQEPPEVRGCTVGGECAHVQRCAASSGHGDVDVLLAKQPGSLLRDRRPLAEEQHRQVDVRNIELACVLIVGYGVDDPGAFDMHTGTFEIERTLAVSYEKARPTLTLHRRSDKSRDLPGSGGPPAFRATRNHRC